MNQRSTPTQIRKLLLELQQQAQSIGMTCRTCDCYQGFVTQLELEAGADAAGVAAGLKVPADQMHGCLGCDPCPPADAFAAYLRGLGQQPTCGGHGCNCQEGGTNS